MQKIPSNIKKFKGTYRPDKEKRKRRTAFQTAAPPLKRPPDLPAEQRRAWDELVRCAKAANLALESWDLPAMRQAVSIYAVLLHNPAAVNASLHGQLRLLLQGLGISVTEPVEDPIDLERALDE